MVLHMSNIVYSVSFYEVLRVFLDVLLYLARVLKVYDISSTEMVPYYIYTALMLERTHTISIVLFVYDFIPYTW